MALTLLVVQLCLGIAAYMTRLASPNDPQPLNPMIAITVAHVACGALVFVTHDRVDVANVSSFTRVRCSAPEEHDVYSTASLTRFSAPAERDVFDISGYIPLLTELDRQEL